MSELHHLLITRFNLDYGDLHPYSEAWMAHRMALFERYCLPSVLRQRSEGFAWRVYFDRARTARHEARVQRASGPSRPASGLRGQPRRR